MTTLTLKLPRATSARLAAAAKSRRVSKAKLVREAIEEHLIANGRRGGRSFAQLAGDLIGSIKDGPVDLASNPKYLEGYGE